MTVTTGAPSTKNITWKTINWKTVEDLVSRLQLRIAKATKTGRYCKAKALQWILTHSFFAKLLAIKRVTQNSGRHTAGVDGVVLKTDKQKINAAYALERKAYKAQPLRRIYIPKKNGKLRPLGIPTQQDRAQQALHLLGLMPIAEIQADKNSYGFRPKRSIHDAIQQCFSLLSKETSSQWILEGYIKACFDKISHQWLLENVMMDKNILKQWLKAGFMEENIFRDTTEGTPQGGIASPTLANITLDGLERTVNDLSKNGMPIHFVRYADDFICTAKSKETLEEKVLPAIIAFLKERGLELSIEKTKITHIDDGFDFLGYNIRKYRGTLLIKPNAASIKRFSDTLRETISTLGNSLTVKLISSLNSKIRGWSNFYSNSVAKKIFQDIDKVVFDSLWRMLKSKHPNKNARWIRIKYFTRIGERDWCFFCKVKDKSGAKIFNLIQCAKTKIKRHIKIKGRATPFDEDYQEYFAERENRLKQERIKGRTVNRYCLKGA